MEILHKSLIWLLNSLEKLSTGKEIFFFSFVLPEQVLTHTSDDTSRAVFELSIKMFCDKKLKQKTMPLFLLLLSCCCSKQFYLLSSAEYTEKNQYTTFVLKP